MYGLLGRVWPRTWGVRHQDAEALDHDMIAVGWSGYLRRRRVLPRCGRQGSRLQVMGPVQHGTHLKPRGPGVLWSVGQSLHSFDGWRM
jgi:hypothetical protein